MRSGHRQLSFRLEERKKGFTCRQNPKHEEISGAWDRNRTGTVLPPRDFKSLASTYSATQALFVFSLNIKWRLFSDHCGEWSDRDSRQIMEAAPGFEPGIKALQASALPLGHAAGDFLERETRFELATLALARRCSTTELFPLVCKIDFFI